MIRIEINGQTVEVPAGGTVLDAARAAGANVPTMCHHPTCQPFSSCMVCVVRDVRRGRLIPSCAARAEEGMVIETDGPEIRHARKTALDLLLSEHVGDCEAPCRRACPLHLNAPLLIRRVGDGDLDGAARTARARIALPRVVARLCHAPCEKACRRAQHDAAVAIRLIERRAAELGHEPAPLPHPAADQTAQVAVIGAGPAGLAAAYHLRLAGFGCVVFDAAPAPGGALRDVPEEQLPASELQADLTAIQRLGVAFRAGCTVGGDLALEALKKEFAAVVLAVGRAGAEWVARLGLTPPGSAAQSVGAVLTDGAGLFACGSAVRERSRVIQALADGQSAAAWAAARLDRRGGEPSARRFDAHIGRLRDGEMAEFLKEADARPRLVPRSEQAGFTADEAAREAARCLHCDCRKLDACRLRECAEAYGAGHGAFRGKERHAVQRMVGHATVVYEPGKCIRCGLCVQITARGKERYGLTFIGRGFDVRIAVPFNESLTEGLQHTAHACVEACPTGALAWKKDPAS